MEKPIEYDKWLERATWIAVSDEMPVEAYILNTFFGVVQQHTKDPKSHSGKSIMDNAMKYVEYFLCETYGRLDDDELQILLEE